MGIVPRRLIASVFRRIGYKIESIKSKDDSNLYQDYPLKSLKEKLKTNRSLGTYRNKPVIVYLGKYGPVIQLGDNEDRKTNNY